MGKDDASVEPAAECMPMPQFIDREHILSIENTFYL